MVIIELSQGFHHLGFNNRMPLENLDAVRVARFDGLIVFEHGKKKKAVEIRDGWPVSVKRGFRSSRSSPIRPRAV